MPYLEEIESDDDVNTPQSNKNDEINGYSKPPCSICKRSGDDPRIRGYSILPNCTHAVCCDCLSREILITNDPLENDVTCPICSELSDFNVQAAVFATGKAKEELVDAYLIKCALEPCEHYSFDQTCPYGADCLHPHIKRDGSKDLSATKTYSQSPGTPTKIITTGDMNKVFDAVEKELETRYKNAYKNKRLSLKALSDRIKTFVQRKLNYQLDTNDWDGLFKYLNDYVKGGLQSSTRDEDAIDKLIDRLEKCGRMVNMATVPPGVPLPDRSSAFRGGKEAGEKKKELSAEEAAKIAETFLPQHLVKTAKKEGGGSSGGKKKSKGGKKRG